MGMAFIGVIAILFGGSSSGGGNPFDGLITAFCVVIYIALLYAYWACGVLFFFWLFEAVGLRSVAPVGLILPIIIPMLIASIVNGVRRSRRSAGGPVGSRSAAT
jgi:hypothetical protein